MTEFKQIIGRGTRINEAFDKTFFTIMDFRNVTDLFADPDFDGDPVKVKEIGENEAIQTSEDEIDEDEKAIIFEPTKMIEGGDIIKQPREKYYVNGVLARRWRLLRCLVGKRSTNWL